MGRVRRSCRSLHARLPVLTASSRPSQLTLWRSQPQPSLTLSCRILPGGSGCRRSRTEGLATEKLADEELLDEQTGLTAVYRSTESDTAGLSDRTD